MSCEEILPLIHGHLDGINTEAEEQQLQAHLQTCPACRSLLSMYEQIDAQVQQLEVEAPEQLAAGVMYKIGLEKNGRKDASDLDAARPGRPLPLRWSW